MILRVQFTFFLLPPNQLPLSSPSKSAVNLFSKENHGPHKNLKSTSVGTQSQKFQHIDLLYLDKKLSVCARVCVTCKFFYFFQVSGEMSLPSKFIYDPQDCATHFYMHSHKSLYSLITQSYNCQLCFMSFSRQYTFPNFIHQHLAESLKHSIL